MAATSISKIKKIKNYRIFHNWRLGDEFTFARVNVIYGANGSGKSTLASLFQECASSDSHVPRPHLVVESQCDGATRDVTEQDRVFWGRVHVFNREYIERNLAFRGADGPRPQALLTIGQRSIDTEAELETLRNREKELATAIAAEQAASSAATKDLTDRVKAVAATIVSDLQGTPGGAYGGRKYTSKNLRDLLQADRTRLERASTDLNADRTLARSSPIETPKLPSRPSLASESALSAAQQLLETEIIVSVIEELRDHPDHASWVQQGIPLHEDRESCLFCGQILSTERWHDLNAHFNTSLTSLQEAISSLISNLETSIQASKNFQASLPSSKDFYPDLVESFTQTLDTYSVEHDNYTSNVLTLVAALRSKYSNPFSTPTLEADLTLTPPSTALIETIAAENASKSARHQQEAQDAARRVELHHAKNFAGEFDSKSKLLATHEATLERMQQELAGVTTRIARLENMDLDPIPSARELTENVARLLGRQELRFTTVGDNSHYAIERSGEPASNLSEGEQTAIALLYFLVSVRADKITGDPPIVVIDDPVSSLDKSILFGTSAQMWTELVANDFASQVFVFTHNFELFRQWVIQCEGAGRGLTGGYKAGELRARVTPDKEGALHRVPVLLPWTTERNLSKKLRSHYHFLFAEVATSLIDADEGLPLAEQMNALALIPNAARRLMESFLAFRYPHTIGDFRRSMQNGLEDARELDPSVRNHIVRYLHSYSHNENADVSRAIDVSEAPTVLRSLFTLLHALDQQHFESMCTALNIESSDLLIHPQVE